MRVHKESYPKGVFRIHQGEELLKKFHMNVANGHSGEFEDSANPYGEYGVRFDTEARAEQFHFLTRIAGDSDSGSIVSHKVTLNSQKRLASLVNASDYAGLRAMINERVSSPEYQSALSARLGLKEELDLIGLKLDKAKARTKLVDLTVANKSLYEVRALNLEFREKYEEMRYLWAQLTEYRIINAQAALASSIFQEEAQRASGNFVEYTKSTIGSLKSLGEYETDSPEWYAARATGIGGSDVGAIMRVDGEWSSINFARVVSSKLGIEDVSNSSLDRMDLRTGIGRGNAWEEYIRQTIIEKNPALNVAFCKTSWYGAEVTHRHANFDGLILDANGVPEGVVEIKTGSDPSKWGQAESGLDGVPPSYRKQVLWYAMNGGLKYGMIVAVLDDHDYREYKFSMSDPALQEELKSMVEATDAFWVDVQEKKLKFDAGDPFRKPRKRGMKITNDYDRIADVYSGYAGISFAQAKKQLVETIEAEKAAKGSMLSEEAFHRSAVKIFSTHNPAERKKPLIGVDLETTTTSPRTGRIIETGIARLNPNGETEAIYGSMHDIPREAKAGVGLGEYAIHKITKEMIAGAPSFDDPAEQKRILEFLKSGTLVAHNAGFEDRFFAANLPGYIEAKLSGEITILDTRKLSSFLMRNSGNSSLKSFAEDNGVPYEGAHAATADAVMMMKALARLQVTIFKHGFFRAKPISEASRKKARKSAEKSNEDR